MTHFKSTIATAVIALSGLVAAQQVMYPRGDEPERPRPVAAKVAEAAAAPAMTWVDPPARPVVEQTASVPPTKAAEPVSDETGNTASDQAMPVQAAVSPPVRHVAMSPEGTKKAEAAKRRRSAQNAARNRQIASRTPSPTETETEVASRAQPNPTPRVDPIGDLLKGLGIGGQG